MTACVCVCMHACVLAYMCVCVSVCVCTGTPVYVQARPTKEWLHVYLHYTCMQLHEYVRTWTDLCVHACMHVCVNVCRCECAYM